MTPLLRTINTHLRVKTDTGVIEGSSSGGILSFKGIPYAAPPIGQFRWRAPQRVRPWNGVREAKEFGHDCIQTPEKNDPAVSRAAFSEDCLVLNIWRPAAERNYERLPVLVWVHGGGYLTGGSSPSIYDGTNFARRGVVFVSFNYRLGRFGFFAHPSLITANEGPVGNFALMDQIEALKWVKHNIAAFGGDPKQITLMGESAGAFSILLLITSSTSKNLFQRAIVMSGGGRSFLLGGRKLSGGTPSHPSADQIGENFAVGVGIRSTRVQLMKALRALPAEALLNDIDESTYVRGPIVDGRIVTAAPEVTFRRREVKPIPMLIGSTTQDLAAIFPASTENPFSYFGSKARKARSIYNPYDKLDTAQIRLAIGADIMMNEPARFVAKQMVRKGSPIWLYRFGYVAETKRSEQIAAPHASELPFLFDTLDARYGDAVSEKDHAIAKVFNEYFVNFVKSGTPNSSDLSNWPQFNPVSSELMLFTKIGGWIAQSDPWKDRLDLVGWAAGNNNAGGGHQ